MKTESQAFKGLYDIVARLRAPDGCPWDREQTPSTLRGDLIEETYECVEAIDEQKPEHIKEELGDIFLLATMISYMHEQEGLFSVSDVLETLAEKLVRRHPHVFGDTKVNGSGEALQNWAKIKIEQEGRAPKDSAMDEVSKALPPLERAYKLQKKAAKLGFDWDTPDGVLAKIQEEITEVQDEFGAERIDCPALEAELGDLLFTVINLCRFMKVDPSAALHRANIKFARRFTYVEKRMKETMREMKKGNRAVMETFWQEAKEDERGRETQ
ncbi:MAG: nucleoside triphosphate pyrophosphohydrolase [Treponema sp.]|jgi:tetrapyrrole methylase family protein/MazG family protein|nr:nucleoside triphosphate pyrophosphohydrolase [Treponema sp.]